MRQRGKDEHFVAVSVIAVTWSNESTAFHDTGLESCVLTGGAGERAETKEGYEGLLLGSSPKEERARKDRDLCG